MLSSLRKQPSFDLVVVDVGRMFVEPVFELVISSKQEFEGFTHHVGWSCIDELSVILQLCFDFFLQTNLKSCSFWFFGWCFQLWNEFELDCV